MAEFEIYLAEQVDPEVVVADSLEDALKGIAGKGKIRAVRENVSRDRTLKTSVGEFPAESMAHFLARESASLAYARLSQDQARYQRIVAVVAAFFGLLGFGSVAAIIALPIEESISTDLHNGELRVLRGEVEVLASQVSNATAVADRVEQSIPGLVESSFRSLETRLEATVATNVESRVGSIMVFLDALAAMASLEQLADILDVQESFSNEQRDATMELVRTVNASPQTKQLPEYWAYLEKILKSFTSANLTAEIIEIDSVARDAIFASQDATRSTANYLGQVLAGAGNAPESWDSHVSEVFDQYRLQVRDREVPATLLPLEVLLLFIEAGGEANHVGVSARLKEPIMWDEVQQALFVLQLVTYTDSSWWTKRGHPVAWAIEDRMRQLVMSYSEQLDTQFRKPQVLQETTRIAMLVTQDDPDGESLRMALRQLKEGGFGALVAEWDAGALE